MSIAFIALSTCCSALVLLNQWNNQAILAHLRWFDIGETRVNVGIYLNNISVLMLSLVSFIALLVHIYSTRYMHNDPKIHRYWSHLGLFCSAMMALVIADNLILMYISWELVGFASYLLIGYWFEKPAASKANKKAFIVNRIGDIGFLIGIMIVFTQFRSFDVHHLFGEGGLVDQASVINGNWIFGSHYLSVHWQTVAGIAFFVGAMAKSAQFPLHVWLPDAMEGPTAVSSLIHAATMVAAGVFLLARVHPLFNEEVLTLITVVGTFTAFMAGTIALVQNDIKRILAYSTVSQLGYMVMAMGVGAQAAGLFHLVTHAFFKCLLFLCAGAVIHEMAHARDHARADFDPQDIRLMGGLRSRMPITFVAMTIAGAALAGIPFTSGFLSKDAILLDACTWAGNKGAWASIIPIFGIVTSWMTVFYICRLLFKVFFGELRIEKILSVHLPVHDAPLAMRSVLCILPLFCVFFLFSVNPVSAGHSWIMNGLSVHNELPEPSELMHIGLPLLLTLGALLIIILTFRRYARYGDDIAVGNTFVFKFTTNQWFVDSFYMNQLMPAVLKLSKGLYLFDKRVLDGTVNGLAGFGITLGIIADWLDRNLVDRLVNGLGWLAQAVGRYFRKYQDGHLQHYYLCMLIVVLALFIYKYITAIL